MFTRIKIDFASDVSCPWCAVGLSSLELALPRVEGEIEAELHFQPFELNPDMPPEGQDTVERLSRKYGMTPKQVRHNGELITARGSRDRRGHLLKNRRMEVLARAQRQYHRTTPWYGNRAGIHSWCAYEEVSPGALSWWDDFQCIISGRRVTVAWCHPRMEYSDEIDARIVDTVDPQTHSLEKSIDGARTYKRVGRSRKRLVGIQRRELTAAEQANYEAKEAERRQLHAQGIPHEIVPSMQRTRMDYGIFVSICAPLEVRGEDGLIQVADLVRRLLRFETTLAREFPGYAYTQSDWLREAPLRTEERADHSG